MSDKQPDLDELANDLRRSQTFFNRSTSALGEAHSSFAPKDGMMSAAAQIMHVALTVEWFVDGAFSATGFDMNFEEHLREANACASLEAARQRLDAAFDRAVSMVEHKTVDEWSAAIADGPVMGGLPRATVLGGIIEHTAHHRGALTVYTRLQGLEPPMPYM